MKRALVCVSFVVLLAGCGRHADGDDDDSSSPTPSSTPALITVTGQVVHAYGYGRPAADFTVYIAGHAPVLTDSAGGFTISDVETPYDISVVAPHLPVSTTYVGLSRTDPTLTVRVASQRTGTLAGTISPGYPLGAGQSSYLYMSYDYGTNAIGVVSPTTGDFNILPSWIGPASASVDLMAIQLTKSANIITSYDAFGTASTTLSADNTVSQNVTVSPISSTTLSGSFTVASGYTALGLSALVFHDSNRMELTGAGTPGAGTFSALAPAIGTGTDPYGVQLAASDPTHFVYAAIRGLPAGATNVQIDLPDVPDLIAPVSGSTAVTADTAFVYEPAANPAVYYAYLTDLVGSQNYFIVTTDTEFTIPDLTTLGIALPSGNDFRWSVYYLFGYASMDDATDFGLYNGPVLIRGEPDYRDFTTQ